jgi:hypothetical protein
MKNFESLLGGTLKLPHFYGSKIDVNGGPTFYPTFPSFRAFFVEERAGWQCG